MSFRPWLKMFLESFLSTVMHLAVLLQANSAFAMTSLTGARATLGGPLSDRGSNWLCVFFRKNYIDKWSVFTPGIYQYRMYIKIVY